MKSPKLHIVLIIAFNQFLSAQVTSGTLQNLNNAYQIASEKYQLDYFNKAEKLETIFRQPSLEAQLPGLKIEEKELEVKQFRADIGLTFKAQFNHNLNEIFDNETNEFVNTRLRTELEWNLIKNGFLSNKLKSQIAFNEAEILKLHKEKEMTSLWRRQFRLSYTYAINRELIELFETQVAVLNNYFESLTELYNQKLIDREILLKVGNNVLITQQELSNYKALNVSIKDSVFPEFKSLKLPFLKLKNSNLSPEMMPKQVDSLQLQILEKKHQWFEDISFSVYANQNWVRSNLSQRSYASVGLRLKVPIKRNFRKERLQIKKQIIDQEQKDKAVGVYNSALTNYNSYREKLKDLNEQYKNWLITEERKRKLQVLKTELDTVQAGINLVNIACDQFEILKNMLQIKRQLYTSLSHLIEIDQELELVTYTFKTKHAEDVLIEPSKMFTESEQLAFIKQKDISVVYIREVSPIFTALLQQEGIQIKTEKHPDNLRTLEAWMLEEYHNLKILQQ